LNTEKNKKFLQQKRLTLMKTKSMNFNIYEYRIQFENGIELKFESRISKTLIRDGLLFVMLELNPKIYDNIYCINIQEKRILWQINADKHRFRSKTGFNYWEEKKSYLKCWTSDGLLVCVSYRTGKILKSTFYK